MQGDVSKTDLVNLNSVEKDNGNIVIGRSGYEKFVHLPLNKKDKYFSNPVDFVRFIKGTEALIRKSKEYSAYIAYLKTKVGLRSCALFHNIDDSVAPIEMHHGPIFTLYDYVEIQIAYMYKTGQAINSMSVANNVLKDHWDNLVQVVMLCQMAHLGVHNFAKTKNKKFFLSADAAFGDFKSFIEKYHDALTLQHVNKIKNYFKFYKEYSETKTKTPMFEAVVTSWADRFDSKEGRV